MGLAESKGEVVPLEELKNGDLLGQGAMCQVTQALWITKNPPLPVALKQMRVPELVPEDLADFRRELQITREMKHPNLVHLHGGCAEPPNLYLVMELVEHGAASDLLRGNNSNLSWALRFRMAIDIALGMRFLHSKKVIHRDLKSENLLVKSLDVDAETVIKISDLGISRFSAGDDSNEGLMTVGRGTTRWQAPEVLMGSNSYSFPVDVFSFGIILWELYAQSMPYAEVRSVLRLPSMIVEGHRPTIPASCPPAYARLMSDCWQSDPTARPTFDEVTQRLFEMREQACPALKQLPTPVVELYERGEKGQAPSPTKVPSRPTSTSTRPSSPTSPPPAVKAPLRPTTTKTRSDSDSAKALTAKEKKKTKKAKAQKSKSLSNCSSPALPDVSTEAQTVSARVRRWESGGAVSPSSSSPGQRRTDTKKTNSSGFFSSLLGGDAKKRG